MTITKLGHCCLLIEEAGIKILTDPGMFTADAHRSLTGIDGILITHEHADHLHMESLQALLTLNPRAKVVTNTAVGRLLSERSLTFEIVEHGQHTEIGKIILEAFGSRHAEIYDPTVPPVQNTGYLVNRRFFYPGDDLHVPDAAVEILAVPVAGPWLKTKEVIEYVKAVHPKICFPVHDAILIPAMTPVFHSHPQKALAAADIQMILPQPGAVMTF